MNYILLSALSAAVAGLTLVACYNRQVGNRRPFGLALALAFILEAASAAVRYPSPFLVLLDLLTFGLFVFIADLVLEELRKRKLLGPITSAELTIITLDAAVAILVSFALQTAFPNYSLGVGLLYAFFIGSLWLYQKLKPKHARGK